MMHSQAFEALVQTLLLCKQDEYGPYVLLLTSSVAFPPEVRQNLCASADWRDFQLYLKDQGARENVDTLLYATRKKPLFPGYRALARLAARGYIPLILTCDPTGQLEEALRDEGCRTHVLAVGGHSDQHVAEALDHPPSGVCVIQLHGNLEGRILPPAFPFFRAFPPLLQPALKRYLNRELLVVGSLAQDQDVASLLARNGDKNLYYVLAETPGPYDDVVKTLEARGQRLARHLIDGELAEFNTFFPALAQRLAPQSASSLASAQAGGPIARANVLLVTVNAAETKAVLELFPEHRLLHGAHQTYHDLGSLQGARVFLVQQASMGAIAPGGTQSTIYESIRELAPETIIMCGIAYGFDPAEQNIGDILVSEQILEYDHQRVSTGDQNEPIFLLRGERPAVSSTLLSRFRSSEHGWASQVRVRFGLIVSGNKLIDNIVYRDQIRAHAPEALGGEMEGAGLYAAAHVHKVDWILVKAISDWADGRKSVNKQQYQLEAARNAARFVVHVLRQGGFTGS